MRHCESFLTQTFHVAVGHEVMTDDLICLVALACDEGDIPGLCQLNGSSDGLFAIRDPFVRGARAPDSRFNVV